MKIRNTIVLLCVLQIALAACSANTGSGKESAPTVEAHDEAHEEVHGAGPGQLLMTEQVIQSAGVQVLTAGPGTVRQLLSLYGSVVTNADRVRDISARYPGVVRSMRHKVGDSVRQGEPLATIESNESLTNYTVGAPLAGVVIARNGNVGEKTGDVPLYTIADLSSVWVELSLFPRDRSKVAVGMPVRISSADGAQSTDGRISYVAAVGQPGTQTLTARVAIDNRDRQWAPGLYVMGEVTLASVAVPVAVHSEALQTLDQKTVVFVRTSDGFEAQPVKVGRAESILTEILSGVTAGTTYAAGNSFVLKSELGKDDAAHEH